MTTDDQRPPDESRSGPPAPEHSDHDPLDRLLDVPVDELPTVEAVPPKPLREGPGEIIGRYKLLQVIGEGGMGEVWMAEQRDPVEQRVALKIIKTGMDTRQVVARFEAERQALAMMNHPNIARIFDGGASESGRPYFVMELVAGKPITDYCDQNKLSTRERLALFQQVCAAIAHAHQKGVIHRDIKPSNILVTNLDGRPLPKVIDFGIAKATGKRLTESTFYTEFGQVIGTLAYMAPEQAQLSAEDVDTRSDVYSLGLLLYVLLTGAAPFGENELRQAAMDEMLRVIREVDPPKPSTKLSSMGPKAMTVAVQHRTDTKHLGRELRGELDWIVMRALEKDRNRRYQSVGGFGDDVGRYLRDEAVEAGPPSRSYRLKKFARRNKGALSAAAAVVLSLVIGLGVALWKYEGEKEARAGESEERERAEKRLGQIEKSNDIMGTIFDGLDPTGMKGDGRRLQIILVEQLKSAVAELDGVAIGDPLVVAGMQNKLGNSLLGLGESEMAIELLRKSWEVRKAKLGPDHPDTLSSMSNLAIGYLHLGDWKRALSLFEENLERTRIILGDDHRSTFISMNNLAWAYKMAGKLQEAARMYKQVLALMDAKLGPGHSDSFLSTVNLAIVRSEIGELEEAVKMLQDVVPRMKGSFGPQHPYTLSAMSSLAACLVEKGTPDFPLMEETREGMEATFAPDHPALLKLKNGLAAAYWAINQSGQAIPLFEDLVGPIERKLGRDHPETLWVIANLGINYLVVGQPERAWPLLKEAYAASEEQPDLRVVGRLLLEAYLEADMTGEARNLVDELLVKARALPAESPSLAGELKTVGRGLLSLEDFREAESVLQEALELYAEAPTWARFHAQSMLGGALLGQGDKDKFARAEAYLTESYKKMNLPPDKVPPKARPMVIESIRRLTDFYETRDADGDAAEVAKLHEELKRWKAAEKRDAEEGE